MPLHDINSLTYLGDVPVVYKDNPNQIQYAPLYVTMIGETPFFSISIESIETTFRAEAIALFKPGKQILIENNILFEYNAENESVWAKIPNYSF